MRWAAAGRSHSRIEETLAGVGVTGSTIIEADCHDLESMRALAAQGKVVINATGPAVTMGENVVRGERISVVCLSHIVVATMDPVVCLLHMVVAAV